jgi:translocation and assembly module TamB
MVTTALKYAALLLLLLTFVLLGVGTWLVGSDAGGRALLAGVNRWTPLTIEVKMLSGRLIDELRLDGVRLRWPGGEAATPTLRLRWQPRQLLHAELTIEELALGEMDIHLTAKPSVSVKKDEMPLQWPRVSGLPRRLHASIASLHLAGMVIHRPAAEAQHFGPLSARLDWQDGLLRLSALQARTPYGSLSGEVTAGMVTPSLALRLHGEGFDAATGLDKTDLTLDLTAGQGGEFLAGPLALNLDTTQQGKVQLNAEVGLSSAGVELRELLLSRSVAAGEVRGRIRYRFDDSVSPLLLQLQLLGVDLTPETSIATNLSGSLDLSGSPDAYNGQFDLSNRGADWRSLRLAGRLAGDRQQLALNTLDGRLLSGQLAGAMNLDWSGPLSLTTTLQGTGLDPGVLSPPLAGQLTFDLNSTLLFPADAPLQVELTARLHDSILNGHPLSGEVSARLENGDLLLRHLELHGNGIDLTAAGRLQEQITFFVSCRHLEELLPDASGAGEAAGWLRWQNGEITGAINSEGATLTYAGLNIAQGALQLQRPTPNSPISLHVDLRSIDYQNRHFVRLELQGEGLPEKHQLHSTLIWPQGEVRVEAAGGYEAGSWSGKILQLAGKDLEQGAWRLAAPVTVLLTKESLGFSPLELTSERGERIEVVAMYDRNSGTGEVFVQWDDLELVRANPWLAELQLAGASSGSVTGRWEEGGSTSLLGKVVAAGRLRQGDLNLTVERLASDFSWDKKGLAAVCELNLAAQSRVSARLTSPEPGKPALPQRLTLQLDWDGLGPELISPWLPPTLTVRGSLSGALTAELYPGRTFEVVGTSTGNNIVLSWMQKKGEVNMALQNADVTWRWQQKTLDIDLALTLVDHGEIAGKLSLPLPAILPVAIDAAGPLRGEAKGRFRERGLLTALLPGLLRESHGDLDLDLRVAGSWQRPALTGNLQLSGAGAYLPQAGITLRDLSITADFADDKVLFPAVKVASGDGQLTGEGELRLQNWQLAEFSGKFDGERFLTLNLPELRIVTSPAFTVSGTTQKIKVRGEIKLPELLVRGRQTQAPLRQHADVLIVDAPQSDDRERPLDLDLEVRLLLGERVLVDFGGIDARLNGDVIVTARGYETITGRGKINVVQGAYAAYGMKLDISRGSLLFAGGPIDQPTLDILALRRSAEVQAGVRVGGTPRAPTVTLYSEPSMPDTDILSYIVLGRPMGSDAGQADLLLVAAGALLAKGESTVLQDRLRRRVGLDVIDIHSGDGDLTTSVITVGKYLSPKLYISLGHSLFTGSNVVGLRYDISERWQTESTVGEESGVDLFYKIEFQ